MVKIIGKWGGVVFLLTLQFIFLNSGIASEISNDQSLQQGYISGKVLCGEDNSPLAGASIVIEGTTLGITTDSKGEFKFKYKGGLPIVLQCSFIGYTTKGVSINSLTNSITIILEANNTILDDVVVTGTRSPKPLKEVPVLTRVVSSVDIERINPMDMQTLLEYEVPGLQFGRSHGSNLPNITFQGMEGPYVLFLLNGERMAGEGSSGNVDFSRFNIDDIERVEVVRGAMSTLYGSSAMGGVINIITKSANRPFVANISGRLDDMGGQKESISLGGNINKFSTLTTATYRSEEPYQVYDTDDNVASMTGYKIMDISQRFGYALTEKIKINLDGSYYQNKQVELVESKVQDVFSNISINPRLKWMLSKNSNLNVSYLYDKYIKEERYQSSSVPNNRIYDDNKSTLRADYVGVFAEKHTITAGVEMEYEDLLHYRLQDSSNVSTQNYVLFAQEDWRVSDKFSIVGGIRADIHSDYGVCPSPKLSMMYRAGNWSFRGGYAMGFRFPSLLERYEEYDMGGLGIFIIYGNPDLKVEKSHQGSFSTEFNKGGFNVSASAYYNRFYDKISMMTLNDGTSDMAYFNSDNGTTAGVDVTLQRRFDFGLTLKGSYSFVNNYEYLDGYNVSSVRPHSATFSAMYTKKIGSVSTNAAFNGRWLSSVNAWYQDDDLEWVQSTYNSRTICSFNVGAVPWRGINVGIHVDNIFDFEDTKIGSDTTLTPERGRSFAFTVAFNIAEIFKL